MTPKKEVYERISVRAKKGDYQLAAPLDYMILQHLPETGTLFGGLFPLGETVQNILTKFTPEQQKLLDTKMLSARLRVLHLMELSEPVYSGQTTRGKIVWQRTPTGTKLVNDWKAKSNGSNS